MPRMPKIASAQLAGQAVVAGLISSRWARAAAPLVRLLEDRHPAGASQVARWLAESQHDLDAAKGPGLDPERTRQASRWQVNFEFLLEVSPAAAPELEELVEDFCDQAPAAFRSASGTEHLVTARRDVNMKVSGGGITFGIISGNITPPDQPA